MHTLTHTETLHTTGLALREDDSVIRKAQWPLVTSPHNQMQLDVAAPRAHLEEEGSLVGIGATTSGRRKFARKAAHSLASGLYKNGSQHKACRRKVVNDMYGV